jgi:hypothetical protein
MKDPELTLLTAVVMLIVFSSLLGKMTATGNILHSETCGPLGCVEACDTTQDCSSELTCCPTSWGTGLCDKAENCDTISIYSRTHAMTGNEAPRQYIPENVQDQQGSLFVPLAMIGMSTLFIVLWFVYRMPTQKMRRTEDD